MSLEPVKTRRLVLYPLTLMQYYNFIFHLQILENQLHLKYQGAKIADEFLNALQKRYLKFMAHKNQPFFNTLWLIINPHKHLIIGNLAFKGIPDEYGSIEIGYSMGPEHQNKGYMTEAVQTLTNIALTFPAVNHITAVTKHNNEASIKVLQNSNFFYTAADDFYLYWTKSTK